MITNNDYENSLNVFKENYDFKYLMDTLKWYRKELSFMICYDNDDIYSDTDQDIESYYDLENDYIFCVRFNNHGLSIIAGSIDYLSDCSGYCCQHSLTLSCNLYDLAIEIFNDFYNYSSNQDLNDYLETLINYNYQIA